VEFGLSESGVKVADVLADFGGRFFVAQAGDDYAALGRTGDDRADGVVYYGMVSRGPELTRDGQRCYNLAVSKGPPYSGRKGNMRL